MFRNKWHKLEEDIIGTATSAGGDAVENASILYNPVRNSDAVGSPALIGTDADGGEAGSVLDGSAYKLGASGSLRRLISAMLAKWTAVTDNYGPLALFIPRIGYLSLQELLSDSSIAKTSLETLKEAFTGGVWITDWFHYKAERSRCDGDRFRHGDNRHVSGQIGDSRRRYASNPSREHKVDDSVDYWHEIWELCYGISFKTVL